jgi:CDP-2,3-bis-(O-geranylgeranyl)-sn-glycerol synthase
MSPPLDPLVCAGFVILAFVLAGLAHSLWLRSRWAARCRVPIDGGRTWRRRPIFGKNKTWAGFLVLPLAAGAAFPLLRLAADGMPEAFRRGLWPLPIPGYALLGVWTGLGFMAGELPNSFIKRQLGVAPGEAPTGRAARLAWFLIDRVDSLLGAFLAQAIVVPVGFWYAFYLLLVGPGLHWLFSALLYYLGVKGRRS